MVEFSEEEYARVCSTVAGEGCSNPTAFTDELGNTWCEDCKQRGDLVNWGATHDWQALEIHPYAIAQGPYYYQIAAAMRDDDMIWSMIGLIEMLENAQEVA